MKKKYKATFDIARKLLKSRIVILSEPIESSVTKSFISSVLYLKESDVSKPIKIFINSPGGSATDGFAIYDILKYSGCSIQTFTVGLCASAAVLVYLAAPRTSRFALPNAKFLLHQPSTAVSGRVSDIEVTANEVIKLRERYNKIVAEETGKTLEKITEDSDRDFWLTSEEALDYGLVGKIISSLSEVK